MDGIYFSFLKIEEENENTYTSSKILGAPVFPKDFLYDKNNNFILDDEDFFIMQLNLKDIANYNTSLPKQGMLYFFINVYTYKPKILFTQEDVDNIDLELWDDINDAFDEEYGEKNGYKLIFNNCLNEGSFILGSINPDIDLDADIDTNGYITLLEIDFLSLPNSNILLFGELAILGGRYIFLINEKDLENLDFSNVDYVDKEN